MLTRVPVDERRTKLVESAIAVAEREGIADLTVHGAAEHAGIAASAADDCFDSTDALLGAMAETLGVQWSESMAAAFGETAHVPDVSGLRGLRMLLHSGLSNMWPMVEAEPERQLLTYELTSHALRQRVESDGDDVESDDAADGQYRVMEDRAQEFLVECARRTGTEWLDPVPAITRLSLALLDGLVLRWLVDRRSEAMLVQLDDVAGIIASKAVEI